MATTTISKNNNNTIDINNNDNNINIFAHAVISRCHHEIPGLK